MNNNKDLIAVIQPDGEFILDWDGEDAEAADPLITLYHNYQKSAYNALYSLGFSNVNNDYSPSIKFLQNISKSFIQSLSKLEYIETLREKSVIQPTDDYSKTVISTAPFMNGMEYLNDNWIKKFWAGLHNVFVKEITVYKKSTAEYFSEKNPEIHTAGKVYFHIVENKNGDMPFAFLATYSVNPSSTGNNRHIPLKHALTEFGDDKKKILNLLTTVYTAAVKSAFISEILESKEIFYPLQLSAQEAFTVLKEIPTYENSGIICRIPDWWKSKSASVSAKAVVGEKTITYLGLNSLLSFKIHIVIGENSITYEEARQLLSETEGLSLIKNKWVEINHEKLRDALNIYERAKSLSENEEITLSEAIRLHLRENKMFAENTDNDTFKIENGNSLQTIMDRLSKPEILPDISCGENFNTVLRPYQLVGLNWLEYMRQLGLGACLADDMGLGKTVQIIGLLNYLQNTNNLKQTLIVVPASLISNWMNEFCRFAPMLSFTVIHPSEKNKLDINNPEILKSGKIFITTYGIVLRNKWLREAGWDYLIIDEAQAIKNPHTGQTKAVKQINAVNRIAMTGTPIENHLTDLWSLIDFLNPAMLGTEAKFSKFCGKLKDRPEGYGELKNAVMPFILRRVKTDKTIISDLPEKIEMKTYTTLTKKQAVMYETVVQEMLKIIGKSQDGIQRKGIIFSAMMKFKQLCNHPDQYTGQQGYSEHDSGKFQRLREICETIHEKRERVIVFTQFKEITEPLANFLEQVFGRTGLVLNGEVPVKKRKEIVNAFQGQEYIPFMVLSIKAGGVGLNLTQANHVIHFDRWWNPAVENQATDRAFRIGQKRNVVVHKFITSGTIEEKIDEMITDKIKLSNDIISVSQESLITEMSNEDLKNLFTLKL